MRSPWVVCANHLDRDEIGLRSTLLDTTEKEARATHEMRDAADAPLISIDTRPHALVAAEPVEDVQHFAVGAEDMAPCHRDSSCRKGLIDSDVDSHVNSPICFDVSGEALWRLRTACS